MGEYGTTLRMPEGLYIIVRMGEDDCACHIAADAPLNLGVGRAAVPRQRVEGGAIPTKPAEDAGASHSSLSGP